MKPIRIAVIGLLCTFALALTPVGAPTHAQSAPTVVTIQNFAFSPATITVSAGTTVVWSNKDSTDHTSTSDTGVWDAGDIPPGTSSRGILFNTPGTYPYHCAIHPNMTGTVIVTGSAPAPTATATPPPPTAGSTAVATPDPTSVPPTSTPLPTPTNTPLQLFVKVVVGHKSAKVGTKQSIKVTTLPGAAVSITLTLPDGSKKHHSARASAAGRYTWKFKQPSGHTTRTKHTVKVAVKVSNGTGSVNSTKRYTVH